MYQLDPSQEAAIEHACTRKFAVITGGAGTGKTTIIKEIIDRIGRNRVALCAFAGKAASRIKEATGHEACTIHRLLGYNGVGFTCESLRGRSVIIDEASMVDAGLMAEIIKREPDRLILVGDASQLPPVGKGQPFHDILAIRPEACATLTKCFRNTEAVFRAATAIRNGQPVAAEEESEQEKWSIVHTGDAKQTHECVIKAVRDGWFDFQQDIILCPKNGDKNTPCTVEALNHEIGKILFPDRQPHERIREGDRVINTKNQSELDIWNGTTGRCVKVFERGAIQIELDTPIDDPKNPGHQTSQVTVPKDMVKEIKLAYALTVHKSQGSQYRKVMFPCLARDATMLLTQQLIYTAVTRTRQECLVCGDAQAFHRGCRVSKPKRTILQKLAEEKRDHEILQF